MDREEIEARAGMTIVMAARAHILAHGGYDQDADDVLGQLWAKLSESFRPYPAPGDYSVHWVVSVGPKVVKPSAWFEARVSHDGKKYKLVHDCTENE